MTTARLNRAWLAKSAQVDVEEDAEQHTSAEMS